MLREPVEVIGPRGGVRAQGVLTWDEKDIF